MISLKERRERLGWEIRTAASKTGTSEGHIAMCECDNTAPDKMLFSERLYDKALLKAEIVLLQTITEEINERAKRKEQK